MGFASSRPANSGVPGSSTPTFDKPRTRRPWSCWMRAVASLFHAENESQLYLRLSSLHGDLTLRGSLFILSARLRTTLERGSGQEVDDAGRRCDDGRGKDGCPERFWQSSGCPTGRDIDDWLRAEATWNQQRRVAA